MSLPAPLYDDVFIFGASMQLDEGKAIGTASASDLRLAKNILSAADIDPSGFAKEIKNGAAVGRRKLAEVQEITRKAMVSAIGNFKGGKLSEDGLRKRMTKVMKVAWKDVFMAGLRSSGVQAESAGKGKTLIALDSVKDTAWLKTAMQHEMRFLNGFLDDIVEDSYSMPLVQRVLMYVDSLRSFYESARVIGLPETCVMHWVGPHDSKSCSGCKYLAENGPYTKYTLPTTPAAGLTKCLTNCRDRILVRRAPLEEVAKVEAGSAYSRGGHIRNLRLLKSGKSA